MPVPFRKRISFLLKLLVSAGFIAWLVFRVNWGEVARRILEVDVSYLALYLVLLVVGIAISARKWQVISSAKGFIRPYRDFFRAYLTGTFINNFFPSTIGGDTYRTLWLGRRNGQLSPAISTALFDRFTGLWAAMVFAILFSIFHWKLVVENPAWLFLDVCILISLSLDFLLPHISRTRIFQTIFSRFPEWFQRLFQELANYPMKDAIFPSLKLSLLFNFVGVGLANLVLFRALGGDVRIVDYLGVIFLVSIVSSLPVSINNIGLKEWAYATFFGYLGASVETAVAVAVTSRFIQMIVSFAAIPSYLRSRDLLGREAEENESVDAV